MKQANEHSSIMMNMVDIFAAVVGETRGKEGEGKTLVYPWNGGIIRGGILAAATAVLFAIGVLALRGEGEVGGGRGRAMRSVGPNSRSAGAATPVFWSATESVGSETDALLTTPAPLGPVDTYVRSPLGRFGAVYRRERDTEGRYGVELFDRHGRRQQAISVTPLRNIAVNDSGNILLWGAEPRTEIAPRGFVCVYFLGESDRLDSIVVGETFGANVSALWAGRDRIAILSPGPGTVETSGYLVVFDVSSREPLWSKRLTEMTPPAFLRPIEICNGRLVFRRIERVNDSPRMCREEVDVETGRTLLVSPNW